MNLKPRKRAGDDRSGPPLTSALNRRNGRWGALFRNWPFSSRLQVSFGRRRTAGRACLCAVTGRYAPQNRPQNCSHVTAESDCYTLRIAPLPRKSADRTALNRCYVPSDTAPCAGTSGYLLRSHEGGRASMTERREYPSRSRANANRYTPLWGRGERHTGENTAFLGGVRDSGTAPGEVV
jgi:hypothetical protein